MNANSYQFNNKNWDVNDLYSNKNSSKNNHKEFNPDDLDHNKIVPNKITTNQIDN